jgi:hypothetical protein
MFCIDNEKEMVVRFVPVSLVFAPIRVQPNYANRLYPRAMLPDLSIEAIHFIILLQTQIEDPVPENHPTHCLKQTRWVRVCLKHL